MQGAFGATSQVEISGCNPAGRYDLELTVPRREAQLHDLIRVEVFWFYPVAVASAEKKKARGANFPRSLTHFGKTLGFSTRERASQRQ